MARRQQSWLDLFSNFLTKYPKVSASIAFELGILAAQATNSVPKVYREYKRRGVTAAGGKVIDALPAEFQRLVGHAPPARRKAVRKSRKAAPKNGLRRGSRGKGRATGKTA